VVLKVVIYITKDGRRDVELEPRREGGRNVVETALERKFKIRIRYSSMCACVLFVYEPSVNIVSV